MEHRQWLYVLSPTRPEMLVSGPTPTEQAAIQRHAAHVSALADQGVMLLVGRTQTNGPDTIGLALFLATDEAAARAIMQSDPAIAGGVMTGELFPYRIAFGNVEAFGRALEDVG